MRRKIAHSPAASIQLFPFLAVLISTMGALAVLLFAFARHGKNQAVQAARAQTTSQANGEAAAASEVLEWQLAQLQTARDKTQEQLTDRRAELSHVEEHLRRLRAEAEELELAINQLDAAGSNGNRDPALLEQQHQRILQQIEAVQRELKDRQQPRQTQPVTYSVVPYQGPNSTIRRPIYIECTRESVIVQPEGIVLNESDFQPPLGPGNPLAAAIRAYGEYLNKAGFVGEQTKPYPMLLVRPDGIEAYYAARGALVSWGSEFGYELIGEDWKLDFPESDAHLATTLQVVIAEARLRQQALALAAPRQFMRSRSGGGLRASANGRGFIREGGDYDEPARGLGRAAGQKNGTPGRGASTGEPGVGEPGVGEPGVTTPWAVPATGVSGGTSTGEPGATTPWAVPATGVNGSRSGGTKAGTQLGGTGESGTQLGETGSRDGRPGGASGDGASSSPMLGGSPGQNDSAADGASGAAGAAGSTAGGGASGGGQQAAGGGQQASGGGQQAAGGGQQAAGGVPQVPLHAPRNTPSSVASRRGEDWGLPDASRGLIPVTRPVIVRCEANRLVIMPDDDRGDPRSIALSKHSEAAVNELVSGVWDHIKDWGTAGRGMYWRPMLVFDVAPGGEARYADFQALLTDSGIEVKQRTRAAGRPATTSARR